MEDHQAVEITRNLPLTELAIAVLVSALVVGVVAAAPIRRGDARGAARAAARVMLVGAVLAVVAMTMVGGHAEPGVNIVPGAGIRTALDHPSSAVAVVGILGNVAVFVPIGFLVPVVFRVRVGVAVLVCAGLSVAIEVVQPLVGRAFDIDDVLLNAIGGAIGAIAGVALVARHATTARGGPSAISRP